jgi:hypothetical protein
MEIKSSSLARRCDICHQSDQFDSTTNICLRCIGIKYEDNLGKREINDKGRSSVSNLMTVIFKGLTITFLIYVGPLLLIFIVLLIMALILDSCS